MKCPLCNSDRLLQHHGGTTCGNCGLVITDQLYDVNVHSKSTSIATLISKVNRDGKGNPLERSQWMRAARLRKMHRMCRMVSYEERILSKAIVEINKMASSLNIPNFVKDTAISIFNNVRRTRERLSIDATIIASLYAACKVHKVPRTIDDFCHSKEEKRSVWKVYRHMVMNNLVRNGSSSPEIYVPRICSLLGARAEVLTEGYRVIKKAKDLGIVNGKSPYKFAVACVYHAMQKLGYKRSKSEVARITGVSEYTIRKIVRALKDI